MRKPLSALALCALVAAGLAGCATSRLPRSASGSATEAGDPPVGAPVAPPPAAPAPAPAAAVVRVDPCPPPPPCPPPSACDCQPTCGLPCENGFSQWHLRGVVGESWFSGTDSGDDCSYYGADVGRTCCGCWGIDGFWRHQSTHFDRDPSGVDAGTFDYVGLKATYEHSFGGGRLYGWVGAGPQYWWSSDYLVTDSGVGVYAEAGLGYILSSNIRLRAGVNLHGLSTVTGRQSPADDGDARWLWLIAPVVEIEFSW